MMKGFATFNLSPSGNEFEQKIERNMMTKEIKFLSKKDLNLFHFLFERT